MSSSSTLTTCRTAARSGRPFTRSRISRDGSGRLAARCVAGATTLTVAVRYPRDSECSPLQPDELTRRRGRQQHALRERRCCRHGHSAGHQLRCVDELQQRLRVLGHSSSRNRTWLQRWRRRCLGDVPGHDWRCDVVLPSRSSARRSRHQLAVRHAVRLGHSDRCVPLWHQLRLGPGPSPRSS